MLRKAGSRGADVLVLDLEDGVHPDVKDEARERIAAFLPEVDFGGAEVLVRINVTSSAWGEKDLNMVSELRSTGAVLPKAETPASVAEVDDRLGGAIPLYLMVETAAGVLAAPGLARSASSVSGLIFGAADYRESLRAGRLPEELELYFARSQMVHAARAAEIEVFDTPWFEYRDRAGLEQSALRARQMGFDGKTAIHPGQVAVINEAFSPTPLELERARRIVAAMEEALEKGRTVATVEGEMVEALHLREARRTLAKEAAVRERGGNWAN